MNFEISFSNLIDLTFLMKNTQWNQNYLNTIQEGTLCDAAANAGRLDVQYPYVVEIPSKLSVDSFNADDKDTTKLCC